MFHSISLPVLLGVFLVAAAAVWLAGKAGKDLPWHSNGDAPHGQDEPRGVARSKKAQEASKRGTSTARAGMVFGVAAVVTLPGGVGLA